MTRAVSLVVGVAAIICGLAGDARAQDPIHWSMAVTSKGPILADRPVDVGLRATIESGWHLYTLDEPAGGPPPTVIELDASNVFALAGSISAPPGLRAFDPNFNVETEFFEKEVVFLVPLRVVAGTANGRHTLAVKTSWVTCNDRICLPPTEATVAIDIRVGAGTELGSEGSRGSKGSKGSEGSAGSAVAGRTRARVPDLAATSQASTFGAYVGLAALMGALSLVTPCVFPMVPITVSYFTNRGRKRRREAVVQALAYGLGIVLTFTGLGFTIAVVFGASGLNRFAADPWLNLGVTAMFVAFALSLFGVWDMALPVKVVTAASTADSGRGPLTGTLLMGLAFTLTSFTCTAPFLGTLLVVASQGDWQWPLAGMLAFSAIFALPFVILAFVPHALASLPRSGPWLTSVKVVMGVIELAAAMKFLSNVDLVWGWHVFTRPVVLTTWVLLSGVLAVYLMGWIRLGPGPRLSRPGVARLVPVAGVVAFAAWLGLGISGRRLGELEAFLPPADLTALGPTGELAWIINDYDAALAEARARHQFVLIDFTGYTCTNCRWMEANMFPDPDVARELARYVRVRLYTDGRGDLYKRFQQMEQSLFGTVALPYYAVIAPDGTPTVGFGGLTRNSAEYVAFLRRGLQN